VYNGVAVYKLLSTSGNWVSGDMKLLADGDAVDFDVEGSSHQILDQRGDGPGLDDDVVDDEVEYHDGELLVRRLGGLTPRGTFSSIGASFSRMSTSLKRHSAKTAASFSSAPKGDSHGFRRQYLVLERGVLSLYRTGAEYHAGGTPHDAFDLRTMTAAWLDPLAADASALAAMERAHGPIGATAKVTDEAAMLAAKGRSDLETSESTKSVFKDAASSSAWGGCVLELKAERGMEEAHGSGVQLNFASERDRRRWLVVLRRYVAIAAAPNESVHPSVMESEEIL